MFVNGATAATAVTIGGKLVVETVWLTGISVKLFPAGKVNDKAAGLVVIVVFASPQTFAVQLTAPVDVLVMNKRLNTVVEAESGIVTHGDCKVTPSRRIGVVAPIATVANVPTTAVGTKATVKSLSAIAKLAVAPPAGR